MSNDGPPKWIVGKSGNNYRSPSNEFSQPHSIYKVVAVSTNFICTIAITTLSTMLRVFVPFSQWFSETNNCNSRCFASSENYGIWTAKLRSRGIITRRGTCTAAAAASATRNSRKRRVPITADSFSNGGRTGRPSGDRRQPEVKPHGHLRRAAPHVGDGRLRVSVVVDVPAVADIGARPTSAACPSRRRDAAETGPLIPRNGRRTGHSGYEAAARAPTKSVRRRRLRRLHLRLRLTPLPPPSPVTMTARSPSIFPRRVVFAIFRLLFMRISGAETTELRTIRECD